jgi:hypothetical protein
MKIIVGIDAIDKDAIISALQEVIEELNHSDDIINNGIRMNHTGWEAHVFVIEDEAHVFVIEDDDTSVDSMSIGEYVKGIKA